MLRCILMSTRAGVDKDLVERCIQGDTAAWARLAEKYSSFLFAAIENRLRKYDIRLPSPEVEDIRQEVIISVWKSEKLKTIENRGDIACWLAIVAGNVAVEYMRKKLRREPLKPVSLFEKIDDKELAGLLPADGPNPRDEAHRLELSQKIDEAIGSLTQNERLVAKLYFLHHKKYEEMAEILKLPTGTVSSYLKRARAKLKDALKDF